MLTEIIQTPEFSAPQPRWVTTASLALGLLLIALLLDRPAQNNLATFQIVAPTTR